MKNKTPLDRLAMDRYYQEVIKPEARKETFWSVIRFLIVVCILWSISNIYCSYFTCIYK